MRHPDDVRHAGVSGAGRHDASRWSIAATIRCAHVSGTLAATIRCAHVSGTLAVVSMTKS